MQPQQPNYDFIMNPQTPPRKSLLGGGSSMAMRILVVVGGIFILMIILAVMLQVFGNSGAAFNKAAMLSVAQDQTEIIRLATRGGQDSVSQTNKNFSVTTELGLTSEQSQLLTYLAEHGYKLDPKVLVLKQSTQTDSQLDAAKSSSTFDTVYGGVMKDSLEAYKRNLSAAYEGANDETKAKLKTLYATADTLLLQLSGN